MVVRIIVGPPASGKSTRVRELAKPGELVVDYDAIATALGAEGAHESKGPVRRAALAAREAAIAVALDSPRPAYIIHSRPTPELLERYRAAGAVLEVLDPGIDTVLQRSKGRPPGTEDAIRAWYADPPKTSRPGGEETTTHPDPGGHRMSDTPAAPEAKDPAAEIEPGADHDEELDLPAAKAKISKANREAAGLRKRLADFEKAEKEREDAKKDDLTKAQEASSGLQKELDGSKLTVARLQVALAKGLTEKQAARLAGSTREELEADADDFLADLGGKDSSKPAPPSPRSREQLRGGGDPTQRSEVVDPKKIADELYD